MDRARARVEVFLLGRFEVVRDGAPIPSQAWRRRRPADLLKLVALTPGRALRRDEVIETLWPGKDAASGANNLHRALYDLRQILGGRWVDLEHGRVAMSPDVWTDIDAFEAASRSPDRAEQELAVTLYRGDLAPEDHDSPWLHGHRARLRSRLAAVALPIARAAVERRDAATAVPLLRRVVDIDPRDEELHRLLMLSLAEGGRRADALRQYEACETALRASSAGPPSLQLRELRDAIQRGAVGHALASGSYDGYRRGARRLLGTSEPPPLRGRTSTLLLFESLVERGSGCLILLGERGVGKSRLAIEGARIAQEAGAIVLTGMFDPARPTPCSAFADLFAEYARAGGTLRSDPFARARPVAPATSAQQAQLFEDVRAQLAAIGGGRPVYLLVDDLHCADECSATLFHFLARAAASAHVMLVATCREDAVHAGTPTQMLLAHLDCERLARGIRVQRLDLAASRQQLGDILGTPPGDALAMRFHRLTDGSPFYTEELARAFKESGHVTVPEDPVAAVRERVARLGPRATSLLETAAVTGRRFELDAILGASGLSAREALLALDEVLEARIVDDDGTGYHFHHSLVRDAIVDALPAPRRASLHRALADGIEERAASAPGGLEEVAERLARHREEGGQPDRAFEHRVTAGHRAWARGGLREASASYESALALADAAAASGPRRFELLEALGQVQLALAELPGALRSCAAALELSDATGWRPGPEQRARVHRHAVLALLVEGRRAEARARLDQGLSDALLGPGDERAELLHLAAQIAWHEGRAVDALDAALRCAEEAQRVGDAGLAARARDLASLASPGGDVQALPSAERAGPEAGSDAACDVHLVLWESDLLGDRPASEIERGVAAFRDRAARSGWCPGVALARAIEGALAARAGRLDVAELALRDAQATARAAGSALVETFALDALATLLGTSGHLDEALAVLGEAVLVAERATFRRHALLRVHATLARNRLAAGAVYAAEDALREASQLASRHGSCAVCGALFRPALIRVALARGRVDEALIELRDADALVERRGGRGFRATVQEARGHVLRAQGQADDAAATFVQAAEDWDRLGAAAEAARCRALLPDAGNA